MSRSARAMNGRFTTNMKTIEKISTERRFPPMSVAAKSAENYFIGDGPAESGQHISPGGPLEPRIGVKPMSSIWDDLREVQARARVRGCDSATLRPARADRRTHPRYDTAGLRATAWVSGREIDVDVVDISLSGISVSGELGAVTDEMDVVVVLHLERKRPLIVACEVARADSPDFAFRFMALDPIQIHSLFFYMYGLTSQYGSALIESRSKAASRLESSG